MVTTLESEILIQYDTHAYDVQFHDGSLNHLI